MRRRLLAGGLGLLTAVGAAGPLRTADSGAGAVGPAPGQEPTVGEAIERALSEPAARLDARVTAECARDGRMPGVDLYGRGFGFWDGKRQFALSPQAFLSVLVTLRDAGFADLATTYGGKGSAPNGAAVGETSAIQVTCRVRFATGDVSREVVQLEGGEQSAALATIAREVYRVGELAARSGVEAASVEDGLRKVGRGELAPEALSLLFHRKPELLASAEVRPGFLIRLSARRASVQRLAAGGYEPPRELELPLAELAELCETLADRRPGAWPANLWAPDYNDLRLAVLGRTVVVQARAFSGLSSATHADLQRDFDAATEAIAKLAERTWRDGEPVVETLD